MVLKWLCLWKVIGFRFWGWGVIVPAYWFPILYYSIVYISQFKTQSFESLSLLSFPHFSLLSKLPFRFVRFCFILIQFKLFFQKVFQFFLHFIIFVKFLLLLLILSKHLLPRYGWFKAVDLMINFLVWFNFGIAVSLVWSYESFVMEQNVRYRFGEKLCLEFWWGFKDVNGGELQVKNRWAIWVWQECLDRCCHRHTDPKRRWFDLVKSWV